METTVVSCGLEHVPTLATRPLCRVESSPAGEVPRLTVGVGSCTPDRDTGEVAVYVVLVGKLDASSASEIAEPLLRFVSGAPEVIIDASGITFIDDGGYRFFESLQLELRRSPGRLVVHQPSRVVRRVMEVVRDRGESDIPIESCAPARHLKQVIGLVNEQLWPCGPVAPFGRPAPNAGVIRASSA